MEYKEKQIEIDKIKINYAEYGNEKGLDMVLLHGWGQNIKTMLPLANGYKTIFKITIIDLPGFGLSEMPDESYGVYEYTEVVKKILDKLKIKKPIMIGHSFGGRLSIVYASKYEVRKLILLASPFEREKDKNIFQTKLLKSFAKIKVLNKLKEWAKNKVGSLDYKNANPIMRKVLVKTVNTNLINEAKCIKCPTLIIWGDNDQAVNVKEAYKLNKLIEDSQLVVFKNKTHYAYLEELNKTLKEMDNFLSAESRENI